MERNLYLRVSQPIRGIEIMLRPKPDQFEITQEQFEFQFNYLKHLQDTCFRGGARDTVGYDDTDVIARHLHMVVEEGYSKTPILPSLWHIVNDQADYARQTWEAAFPDLALGEICVRWLSYPAQEPKNSGRHTDFCAMTVPLYSSRRPAGLPFFGQMAEDFDIPEFDKAKSYEHCFTPASDTSALYVVAFCQLPMDSIDRKHNKYADMLTRMCSSRDRTNTRKY